MVLINEKKYACEKCIKGHRVSGCTHTDRPLYEIKKKGRPTTQCSHCKDKRKLSGSSVHTKCACGDAKTSQSTPTADQPITNQSNPVETPITIQGPDGDEEVEFETRKGQPGSKATFPRGFKDVLELASAANALAGLVGEDTGLKVAERSVSALLNPCRCQSGGPCKCCQPKKNEPSSGSLGESSSPAGGCCGSSSTNGSAIPPPIPPPLLNPHLSPENMHHPAHTSPHVHKVKLYSPYSSNPASQSRRGRRDTIGSNKSSGRSSPLPPKTLRPPPPTIKPLTDFGRLIGAAINQDGSFNSEIPRSAVGLPNLPGISTFDTAAENGGTKVEPMEYEDIDVDMPLAFPTNEDVVIGACMCGEDCPCPGCATHDNGISTSNEQEHNHEGGAACGEGCKGRHDCNHSIAVPSGVTSIAQLISLAASHVPAPPKTQTYTNIATLDPHDTRILPPSVQVNEDIARTMGIIQLKPLECCNGRCQCPPGNCICEKECCGCCVRCACDEEDEDARMIGDDNNHNNNQSIESVLSKSSCCSTSKSNNPPPPDIINRQPSPLDPSALIASATASFSQIQPSPTLLSPDHAFSSSSGSRQPSPTNSGSTTPVNIPSATMNSGSIRRSTSISSRSAQEGHDTASSHRRATVTGNPPAIAVAGPSKSTTKAIAPYNAQHHRTILPKPSSSKHLTVNTNVNASESRQPSPSGRKRNSSSAGPTRSGSPNGGDRIPSGSNTSTTKGKSAKQLTPVHPAQNPNSQIPSQASHPFSTQHVVSNHQIDDNFTYQWNPDIQQIMSQNSDPCQYPQIQSNNTSHIPTSGLQSIYPNPQNYSSNETNIDPSNAALLAFLQQFTQTNSQSSQAQLQPQPQPQPQLQAPSQPQPQAQSQQSQPPQFDEQWFNRISQQPGLSHDVSGNTSPELDQPFDLDQFISQALGNSQSQNIQFQTLPQSQPQRNLSQSQHQPQHQQQSIPSIPDFADFFLSSAPPQQPPIISHPISYNQQIQPDFNPIGPLDPSITQNQLYNPQSNHSSRNSITGNDTDLQFVTLVPGLPVEASFSPNWTSATAKEDIVQARKRQLKEISSQQNQSSQQIPGQFANGISTQQPTSQISQHQQQQQQHLNQTNYTAKQFSASTGDMIDLSQPLNADTLNKIMKALQKHNDQITPSTSTSTQNETTPTAYNDETTPKPSNDQSQTYIPHVDPTTVPIPNHSIVNGVPGTGVTKDLDDMFSQFVTLDGVGVGGNSNQNALLGLNGQDNSDNHSNEDNNNNNWLDLPNLNLNNNLGILHQGWGKSDIWGTGEGYI